MQCIKWGDEYALSGSMHLFSQNALANTSHPSSPIRNKKRLYGASPSVWAFLILDLVALTGGPLYLGVILGFGSCGLYICPGMYIYPYNLVPPSLPLFSFLSNICIKKYRKCWSEEICREYESSSGARIWTDSAILMILLFEKLTCFDFGQMG